MATLKSPDEVSELLLRGIYAAVAFFKARERGEKLSPEIREMLIKEIDAAMDVLPEVVKH